MPAGGAVTVTVADTYTLNPGVLVVNKTITGRAAGDQGAVRIHVDCSGAGGTFVGDFDIPAGTVAGTESTSFDVPGNVTCTVTEPVTGATGTVTVDVSGSPQTVTVDAGGSGQANLTDTYDYTSGSLTVAKTIAGSGASSHGPITIEVTCDGVVLSPVFTIAAGDPGASQTYDGIPGNTECFVVETVDGHTSTVTVSVDGGGEVTVPAGGAVTVTSRGYVHAQSGRAGGQQDDHWSRGG